MKPLILSVLTLSVAFAPSIPDEKPNIIYILADDLGYGDLGCYGQKKILTPHLDRIAAEGMRFTQHYSGAAVCAPSRFTLVTGKHIGRSTTYGQSQRLKPNQFTIHKLLKKAGYTTASIGKWGLGKDPNKQGNDLWYGFTSQAYAHFYYPERIWKDTRRIELPENSRKNGLRANGNYTDKISDGVYIHDEFTREALGFIRKNKDAPFFLYLPYTIPHLELVVPEDSLAEYEGRFPERPFDTRGFTHNGKPAAAGGTAFYDGKGYCSTDKPRATLAAMITRMDRDIGRILEVLKELGIDEKTLIMFSSDNGPNRWEAGGCDRDFFNSSGGLRNGKGTYYEGGLRVPMIARWPGRIKADSITDHVSYFPDILPTVADLLGSDVPEELDGKSLLPTLLGEGKQQEHEFLFWAHAVRMGKWKYVHGGKQYDGPEEGGQLFDLEKDPGEKTDVADQHTDVVDRIRKIIENNRLKKPAKAKR